VAAGRQEVGRNRTRLLMNNHWKIQGVPFLLKFDFSLDYEGRKFDL
jgi:hypothetical protein